MRQNLFLNFLLIIYNSQTLVISCLFKCFLCVSVIFFFSRFNLWPKFRFIVLSSWRSKLEINRFKILLPYFMYLFSDLKWIITFPHIIILFFFSFLMLGTQILVAFDTFAQVFAFFFRSSFFFDADQVHALLWEELVPSFLFFI